MKKIIFLIPLLLVFSCADNSFDPTLLSDGFKGITRTGPESPEPLGGMYDPSDWCTGSSNYFSKENVEFPGINYFEFSPCYPNPIDLNGYTNIRYAIAAESFVKIYLIDKHQVVRAELVNGIKQAGVHMYTFLLRVFLKEFTDLY